jgi:AcrR family transcriptional regulator
VEAAAQLITEKGWEATTAADIGRRAGYSRAMVHARYGGKDAVLDTLFRSTYEAQADSAPTIELCGLIQAVTHFDRIIALYAEDRDVLRAIFVLAFEAVKSASPMRARLQQWLTTITDNVTAGLQSGLADGSVRSDVDVASATVDISTAGLGVAHLWMVLGDEHRLDQDLKLVRDRIIRDYGAAPAVRHPRRTRPA